MRSDVQNQIRSHYRSMDEAQVSVEFEEIVERVGGLSAHRLAPIVVHPRRSRAWLVGIAAFVGVLLVLGGLAVLFDVGGGSDPATPTTVIVPTTVDSPEPSTPESALVPAGPDSVVYSASFLSGEPILAEVDVWYLDSSTWRMKLVESAAETSPPEEMDRRVYVKNGDAMFVYSAWTNTFEILDLTNADPFFIELDPVNGSNGGYSVQLQYFACDDAGACIETCIENGTCVGDVDPWDCSTSPGETIAGLDTTFHECTRQAPWITGDQTLELWIAADCTNLKWQETTPQPPENDEEPTVIRFEITEIQHPSEFDSALFDFECPSENCTDVNAGSDPLAQPMVGQPAPETSGNLLTGEPFELSEFIGGKVIVAFEASWCPPCADHLTELQTLQERSRDITIIVLLPADEPATARKFLDQNDIRLLAADPSQENNTVTRQWQTPGYPTTYLIDENGTIQAVFVGVLDQAEIDQVLNELGW
ncbi:MAG: TlpA family protein disulfide reductase [Acidobacteria bacterium]|nr:TlpA family protein disulfide reductase [Acidobacteriota bacterium]